MPMERRYTAARRRTAANPWKVHSKIALNLMSWQSSAPPSSAATSTLFIATGNRRTSSNGQQQPPFSGGPTKHRWSHFFNAFLQQMDPEGNETEKPQGWAHKVYVVIPHVGLFFSTLLYALFGALVFQRLERPFEVDHLREHSEAVALAQLEFLKLKWVQQMDIGRTSDRQKVGFAANSTSSAEAKAPTDEELEVAVDNLIRLHMEAFGQGIRADELANAIEDFHARRKNIGNLNDSMKGTINSPGDRSPKWHFHSSLFFTATLLTSIGYGNLVPISPLGRLFCIAYAFLGIPLTLITIADLAKYLSEKILKIGDWLEERICKRNGKDGNRSPTIQVKKENEEDGILMRQPGPYTKAFVIFLLFAYMWTMAALFTRIQPGWGFLESLYFTLITLVTIGFGDFCPTLEGPSSQTSSSSAAFGWIFFIFVGLTLSTLTVDMIGARYIYRIHTFGRGFHLGSLLAMLKIGRGDAGPDSARLLKQLHAGAFIPADLKMIPYIDQLLSQRPSAETVFMQQDNGNGPPNGQRRFRMKAKGRENEEDEGTNDGKQRE